ncbi:LLM class flavin-dependent oxidoreductase [Actinomadura parmotrematis]|uniref:LLM class flavin-dependent oxidoreductase n=1 Tax=Actinomadura parmotrematis TaxID=2864039 RepID=A0ABS7G0M7_9ACTN|nr:LLM class flavin-dependent oxidoreductase [Actinomadura parmotrematis]MBW8485760.1 LLM class flavin-dependent oxidoreductase [Actinomadura parmotrematis]
MGAIRFSLFYEHQLPRPWDDGQEARLYRDALDQIEIADRIGFDIVWEVEHHFLEEYSHSSAPEVFLAAASQRTKRIRLGHGIVQLPPEVNHPARVAERIATLDLVSGGRVEFGTGESSSSAELGGFGIRRSAKRGEWEDAVDAVTRMFVEEPFAGWDSPHLRMPPRNVIPKTVQKPHPPLWVACSRRETIEFAARNGIGALSFSFVEPADAGRWVQEYYRIIESEECVPAGFSVNPNVCVVLPMMLHEDEATAIERGIDGAHFFGFALAHYYGTTPHDPGRTSVWDEFQARRAQQGFDRDRIIANAEALNVNVGSLRGAVGTPDQVSELIRKYEEVGVDQISFVLQAGPNRHEHICEALELFGKAVLPRFTEGREEREAAKAARLAPAIEAALARREPARTLPAGYRIDEDAEVARARRARRPRVTPGAVRAEVRGAGRRRALQGFHRLVKGRSDRQIERAFGERAQRVFFAGMARAYDPSAAGGFEGDLAFRLGRSDGTETAWTIRVRDGRARAREGAADDARLTIAASTADFVRVLAGDGNPASLLMDGKLRLRGDVEVAPRVSEMFGGPSPY